LQLVEHPVAVCHACCTSACHCHIREMRLHEHIEDLQYDTNCDVGAAISIRYATARDDGLGFRTIVDLERRSSSPSVNHIQSPQPQPNIQSPQPQPEPEPQRMGVVVQLMVAPIWAGVVFTVDPVETDHKTARGQLVINATPGLGDRLVAGAVTGESIVVQRDPSNDGGGDIDHPHRARAWEAAGREQSKPPTFPTKLVRRVVAAALRVEQLHNGQPQDIEWAIDQSGALYLLQTRPITATAAAAALLASTQNRGTSTQNRGTSTQNRGTSTQNRGTSSSGDSGGGSDGGDGNWGVGAGDQHRHQGTQPPPKRPDVLCNDATLPQCPEPLTALTWTSFRHVVEVALRTSYRAAGVDYNAAVALGNGQSGHARGFYELRGGRLFQNVSTLAALARLEFGAAADDVVASFASVPEHVVEQCFPPAERAKPPFFHRLTGAAAALGRLWRSPALCLRAEEALEGSVTWCRAEMAASAADRPSEPAAEPEPIEPMVRSLVQVLERFTAFATHYMAVQVSLKVCLGVTRKIVDKAFPASAPGSASSSSSSGGGGGGGGESGESGGGSGGDGGGGNAVTDSGAVLDPTEAFDAAAGPAPAVATASAVVAQLLANVGQVVTAQQTRDLQAIGQLVARSKDSSVRTFFGLDGDGDGSGAGASDSLGGGEGGGGGTNCDWGGWRDRLQCPEVLGRIEQFVADYGFRSTTNELEVCDVL
jgi:uncharacterized membrane protein YgcG